ncbi:hypothetical protein L9F63_016345 [Diploptera punctata]|uniref:Uncharacterized protein n=1 Tax=Diploptera punctata TaxID=6984 RepID=A0AAD8A194_DIPPU|nr:hypothetical protein L9F63_016345 [Diploptera punctata]
MVVMYTFAFWFSTRFGSLVVAGITMFQSFSLLIACCIWVRDQNSVKNQFDEWLNTNEMIFMKNTLEDIRTDPEPYLTCFIIYLSAHCFSIILLACGVLKVVLCMVYPFLAMELARLVFITIYFIVAMLLVKENVKNLGFLIACCCGGGFLLLFLYYLWFCVLSFVQIVKELEIVKLLGHHQGARLNTKEYKHFHVPEIGSEYYQRDRFPQHNPYKFSRKYVNDRFTAKFDGDVPFTTVLARPAF